jgi:hypothetical protein
MVAYIYFKEKLDINGKGLYRLITIAHDFITKTNSSDRDYNNIWSAEPSTFSKEKISRVHQLFDGWKTIIRKSNLNSIARRFTLVFIYHEIDERMRSISGLNQYERRLQIVSNELARELTLDSKSIRSLWKTSKAYLELLTYGGPGDLLTLGDSLVSR